MTAAVLALASLVGLLVFLVLYLLRDNAGLRTYKQRYRYTDDDVEAARAQSRIRSKAVVSGNVQEHLAPLLPAFADEFNFKEARFIGQPIDYIVFDGLDQQRPDMRVVFVEVKTGKSGLNERERLVKDAVEAKRVEWKTIRLAGLSGGTPDWSKVTATFLDSEEAGEIAWDEDY